MIAVDRCRALVGEGTFLLCPFKELTLQFLLDFCQPNSCVCLRAVIEASKEQLGLGSADRLVLSRRDVNDRAKIREHRSNVEMLARVLAPWLDDIDVP